MRVLLLIALVAAASVLAACGGDSQPAAPGSPDNPLVAERPDPAGDDGRSNEAAAAGAEQPGYQALVERQGRRPRSRFSPCNLVTRAQARAIVGAPISELVEAPQGPTCIYRSQAGDDFITLAVQSAAFDRLRRQMYVRRRVDVADRPGYCGTHGRPILYVPLSGGRVLSIAAPCSVARRFAVTAVRRLTT